MGSGLMSQPCILAASAACQNFAVIGQEQWLQHSPPAPPKSPLHARPHLCLAGQFLSAIDLLCALRLARAASGPPGGLAIERRRRWRASQGNCVRGSETQIRPGGRRQRLAACAPSARVSVPEIHLGGGDPGRSQSRRTNLHPHPALAHQGKHLGPNAAHVRQVARSCRVLQLCLISTAIAASGPLRRANRVHRLATRLENSEGVDGI